MGGPDKRGSAALYSIPRPVFPFGRHHLIMVSISSYCRGVGTGAAGAAKAAPIIFEFILFIFLHFNLVGGLSTLVQVPCFTWTMRCIISMHILFIILYGFLGPIFKKIPGGGPPHPPLTLWPHQC